MARRDDRSVQLRCIAHVMAHLNEAADKGLVTEGGRVIAADLNKARDDFLHWMPGRPSRPVYRGVDITTHEGLRVCLLDVKRFLETEGISRGDNPVTRKLDELGRRAGDRLHLTDCPSRQDVLPTVATMVPYQPRRSGEGDA